MMAATNGTGETMENDSVADDLRESVVLLCEAVGGPGCVLEVGYLALRGPSGATAVHRFGVIVEPSVQGALIGKGGKNAERMRELLRTRLSVLGRWEGVEMRTAGDRDEIREMEGATWGAP